jgi:hypothetical protein
MAAMMAVCIYSYDVASGRSGGEVRQIETIGLVFLLSNKERWADEGSNRKPKLVIDVELSLHLCFEWRNKDPHSAENWRWVKSLKRLLSCEIEGKVGRQMVIYQILLEEF